MNSENRAGRLTLTQDIAARIAFALLLTGGYVAHEAASPRPAYAQDAGGGDFCETGEDGRLRCVGGQPDAMAESSWERRQNNHQYPEQTTPDEGPVDGDELIAYAQSTSHQMKKDAISTITSLPGEAWGYVKAGVGVIWQAGYDSVASDTSTVMCNGVETTIRHGESVIYDDLGNCKMSGTRPGR